MCATRKQKNKSRQKKKGEGEKTIRKRGERKETKTPHTILITHNTFYFHTQHTTHTFTFPTSSPQTSSLPLKALTHNCTHIQLHTQNTQTFVLAYSFVLTQVVLKTIDNQQTKHIVLAYSLFCKPAHTMHTIAYTLHTQ